MRAIQLLKKFGEQAHVDIIDRLPTPFGLVRSGVAPDHQDTKNVINQFTKLAQDPRLSFLGNVTVGRDISLPALRLHYNGVVLAYGAESNRKLGVPGEDLQNSLSAREFVWWYNGHPDYASLPVDLSKMERVAIIGLGNVALDCARVLLRGEDAMGRTDIARHAQEARKRSAVKRVDIIGRRGAVQAAFTTKELREITKLPGVQVHVSPEAMQLTEADEAEIKASRIKKRVFDILKAASEAPKSEDATRHLHMHFLRTPLELLPRSPGCPAVGGVKLEVNKLQAREDGSQTAIGLGQYESLPADMVLSSIGYRSEAIEGVAFDARRGVVMHREGRVLQASSQDPEPGLYVVGWAKRGPTGIIGTNLVDASETADCIAEDVQHGILPGRLGSGISEELARHKVQVVDFGDWQNINAAEVTAGQQAGKPREKFVEVAAMLEAGRALRQSAPGA
ncbi:g11441 [Coccomyxa viridis]|uniref:NADPH:adrenodoxin oxidoreductase, mitochondrial n=1 Tax=Coccomyxa viridis TaxID=1274662 RepID=A0ABP1GAL2_9CHLO